MSKSTRRDRVDEGRKTLSFHGKPDVSIDILWTEVPGSYSIAWAVPHVFAE